MTITAHFTALLKIIPARLHLNIRQNAGEEILFTDEKNPYFDCQPEYFA